MLYNTGVTEISIWPRGLEAGVVLDGWFTTLVWKKSASDQEVLKQVWSLLKVIYNIVHFKETSVWPIVDFKEMSFGQLYILLNKELSFEQLYILLIQELSFW